MSNNTFPFFRSEMIGKHVTKATLIIDKIHIDFDGSWSVVISANAALRNSEIIFELKNINLIEGSVLINFIGDEVNERMIFDNELEIIIFLDEIYDENPESMVVYGPNNVIVVWN